MQFLRTLFWVVVAVLALLFAINNWYSVDLKLGDIIVAIKMPLLVFIGFAMGFLPTWIIYRARIWSLQRRLDVRSEVHVANAPPPVQPRAVPAANMPDRQATDSKAWPAE
jgi:putative membrane protein